MSRFDGWLPAARSGPVWQALGIYLAAGWAVLQMVDLLMGLLPLPDWASLLALSLLVAGLPVVVATALFQQRRRVAEGDGAQGPKASGMGSADAGTTDAPPALERVFTWRNALLGGVAASLLWGGIAAGWILFARAPDVAERVGSLAVLPFEDLSPARDQDYFAEGLAEEIRHALTNVGDLRVPGRASSSSFASSDDPRTVGQALGVQAVLGGTVRKQGTRVRITAELVDTRDGFRRWSEAFEGDLGDIFALQRRVSRGVVGALRPDDAPEATLDDPVDTRDVEAYDRFLRGRHELARRTPESMQRAVELFRDAIALDPAYVDAYVGLAESYTLQALNLFADPVTAYPLGIAAARRAVDLDVRNPHAHAALGLGLFQHERAWAEAERSFRTAMDLGIRQPEAHYYYSLYLSAVNRHDEAIDRARLAQSLDPLSPPLAMGVGIALMHAGRLAEGVTALESAITLAPDYYFPHAWAGVALARLGRDAEAVEHARRAVHLNPQSELSQAFLAETLALVGRTDEAVAVLDALGDPGGGHTVPATYMARTYAALGRLDEAVHWLEEGLARGEGQASQIAGPGYADVLGGHPRYDALIRSLGLPEQGDPP